MTRFYSMFFSLLILFATTICYSQTKSIWTEADRKFLIENLQRTKLEITEQTKNLTSEQWAFKEDSTKWTIGQVLEHLGLYERIFAQEADIMLSSTPEPHLDGLSLPDTSYINWMNDPSPHQAEWNAEPLGLMKGRDNLTYFLFGREHIIEFVKNTKYDLKSHFTFRWGDEKRRSIHALMVVHFGHTDRHLKQVKRIKNNPKFPK